MNQEGGEPTGDTGNAAPPLGTKPCICGMSEQLNAEQDRLKREGMQFEGLDFNKKGSGCGELGRQEEFELGVTVMISEVAAWDSLPAANIKEVPEEKGKGVAKMPASSDEFEGVTVKLNG